METRVSICACELAKILIAVVAVPYRQRVGTAGTVFHVLNRGVRKLRLFDRPGDYRAFLKVFREAQERIPIGCLAYCLMPNHFHLVLWPRTDSDLSAFMAWLTATHSKRWHAYRQTAGTGHVYQGRYKAFPVCSDMHFLRLCRYVERNALRAGLVARAENWPWSSLAQRAGRPSLISLTEWPVTRPPDWSDLVQLDVTEETQELRQAVSRGAPYGPEDWRVQIASQLQLKSSLAPVGRPRNRKKTTQVSA
jgi:putative transposase